MPRPHTHVSCHTAIYERDKFYGLFEKQKQLNDIRPSRKFEVQVWKQTFLVLIIFYFAYRLNRDEGIIVMLQERVTGLENFIQALSSNEKIPEVEEK